MHNFCTINLQPCSHQHAAFEWTPTNRDQVQPPAAAVMISDSLCRFVRRCDDIHIYSRPGLDLQTAYLKIKMGFFKLEKYKILIIHLGYSDCQQRSKEWNVQKFLELVNMIRSRCPNLRVALSSILSRPVDGSEAQDIVIALNNALRIVCRKHRVEFLRTYNAIERCHDDCYRAGRHLNSRGNYVVRRFFTASVKRLKSKPK